MGRRRARVALLVCLCAFFLLVASPAGAQKVILKNLVVDDSQGVLRLHFGLRALDGVGPRTAGPVSSQSS